MVTLEQIIKQQKSGDVNEALGTLTRYLKEREQSEMQNMTDRITALESALADSMKAITAMLDKIASRPDPVFPAVEIPPYPEKMAMDKPDWYKDAEPMDYERWTKMLLTAIRPLFADITVEINKLKDDVSLALQEDESPEPTAEPQAKTVNTGSVRSRRITQWKRFDNYDLKNIISQGDGITYFLPDSLIPNSEDVKLNGGSPLKNSDYTLTGNKLVFNNGNQSTSQIEVRGQVK